MAQLGFYYDMTTCTGCKTCQIACKDKNNLDTGVFFRQVRRFEGGKFPNPWVYNLSTTCNHCQEAKCVRGCPTGAMHYGDDGTVQHDPNLCIGCKYCVMNCPYSVPQYLSQKNVVSKCDSCAELRKAGEEPACVAACQMRCLKFGDLEELKKEYGPDLVSELPVLPSASITKPSLLIKANDYALDPSNKKAGV